MKNWERNFCLASVADAPSSGETVRNARHPAGVTLDPECSPQSGTALRNGGNMVLPLCGVGGVCSQQSTGNLYYSVLCMERVKLAFPQFVQSWCLKEFENPILSCQLISLTMKIPQLLCVAWQTILSFFFNNISFFT